MSLYLVYRGEQPVLTCGSPGVWAWGPKLCFQRYVTSNVRSYRKALQLLPCTLKSFLWWEQVTKSWGYSSSLCGEASSQDKNLLVMWVTVEADVQLPTHLLMASIPADIWLQTHEKLKVRITVATTKFLTQKTVRDKNNFFFFGVLRESFPM
jgi:hypothetical protein